MEELYFVVKINDVRKFKQLILAGGIDINGDTHHGWTLLHLALSRGHLALAHALILLGIDVNVKDYNGWTALHHAAYSQRLEIIKKLIAHGADITLKDNMGKIPFDFAKTEKIKQLLTTEACHTYKYISIK